MKLDSDDTSSGTPLPLNGEVSVVDEDRLREFISSHYSGDLEGCTFPLIHSHPTKIEFELACMNDEKRHDIASALETSGYGVTHLSGVGRFFCVIPIGREDVLS